MQRGMLLSLGLHLALAAAILIGVPSFGEPMRVSDPIAVDVVSEVQLARKSAEEAEPEPAPEPEPEVGPEPAPPPAPEPPPVAEAAPPAPAPPEPEPTPAPDVEAEPAAVPLPQPQPKPSAPEPAQREAEPAPPRPPRKPPLRLAETPSEPEEPEPREDRLTSILKNVERDLKQAAPESREQEPQERPAPAPAPEPEPRITAASQRLSASQLDAIRRQIERCWNPPVGARDAEDLVVELRVQLNPDGTVQRAEIVSTDRLGDPFYRSAAESALRAVRICSPLKGLPARKYETWRDMKLTFNPQEML